MKAAIVAVIGRPSAGKSSLVNALCGYKLAIVSPVPQTTRSRVRGIVQDERGQLVLIDTPGFHSSQKRFNLEMVSLVTRTLEDADILLYVRDRSRSGGEEESALLERYTAFSGPKVVALTKCDLPPAQENQPETAPVLAEAIQISIPPGDKGEKKGLEELKSRLFGLAAEGEALYPEDYYTDQPQEFRIAEIIREKAILATKQELPHSLYVEIQDVEMQKGPKLWIRAEIIVDRESQKGIVVGKGGERIKAIGQAAREELEEVFGYHVRLDLRVKTHPNWRQDAQLLRRITEAGG